MRKGKLTSIQKTLDGGYVIIGRQIPNPFLAKINGNGDILWTRSFSIQADLYGKLALCQSSSGDLYFSNGLNGIIKTNDNGDSLWYQTFNVNNLHSLIYTSDDCLVACGDDGILKLDLTGNVIWEKFYNSPKFEILQSIYETNDNGFISVGSIDSMDMADIFILRYNAEGDTLWTKVISSLSTIESAQDVFKMMMVLLQFVELRINLPEIMIMIFYY